ncbi:MAG: hypothetical protein JSS61_04375 [Verrucomicrobia bacterium]|nr:hypothetical protein [Verrucomicrobiota bacterium]
MPSSIQISHPSTHLTWRKDLSEQEAREIMPLCQRARIYSAGLCWPIRTHNWKDFAKDFFLPTVVNQAFRTNHIAIQIFIFLGGLVQDILTFPIRVITCIPRYFMNPRKEDHPFYQYLKAQKVDPLLLVPDYVQVELFWETDSPRMQHHSDYSLNFIEMPSYDSTWSFSGHTI